MGRCDQIKYFTTLLCQRLLDLMLFDCRYYWVLKCAPYFAVNLTWKSLWLWHSVACLNGGILKDSAVLLGYSLNSASPNVKNPIKGRLIRHRMDRQNIYSWLYSWNVRETVKYYLADFFRYGGAPKKVKPADVEHYLYLILFIFGIFNIEMFNHSIPSNRFQPG